MTAVEARNELQTIRTQIDVIAERFVVVAVDLGEGDRRRTERRRDDFVFYPRRNGRKTNCENRT